MNIIQDNKLVNIRKPHVCFACGRRLVPPAKMWNQIHDYDGITSVYSCITCQELMDTCPKELFDEGERLFMEGCTWEMVQEYQREYPEICNVQELLEFKKQKL